jgi:hypothetical protein
LPFVKDQAEFHQRMIEKYGAASFRASMHKTTAANFRALIADLESADQALDEKAAIAKPSSPKSIQLSLTLDDIQNLPEELLSELSLSDADKTEFAIVNAIEEAGGIISLDRLLISLYKATGEVHKRTSLYSRLARMANKNTIYYVPGKKGVYSTEQLSSEDVLRIFGVAKAELDQDD